MHTSEILNARPSGLSRLNRIQAQALVRAAEMHHAKALATYEEAGTVPMRTANAGDNTLDVFVENAYTELAHNAATEALIRAEGVLGAARRRLAATS